MNAQLKQTAPKPAEPEPMSEADLRERMRDKYEEHEPRYDPYVERGLNRRDFS